MSVCMSVYVRALYRNLTAVSLPSVPAPAAAERGIFSAAETRKEEEEGEVVVVGGHCPLHYTLTICALDDLK